MWSCVVMLSFSQPEAGPIAARFGALSLEAVFFEALVEIAAIQRMRSIVLAPFHVGFAQIADADFSGCIGFAPVLDKILEDVGFVPPTGDGIRDFVRLTEPVFKPAARAIDRPCKDRFTFAF